MADQPPPPGWYQDPGDATQLRWWDGLTWTAHAAPGHGPPPPPTTPYGSPSTHCLFTTIILAAAAIAGVFAAFALFHRADVVDDFNSSSATLGSLQKLQDADDLAQAAGVLELLTFVGAYVALAVCTHRLYKNLPALGAAALRYTSGWAAGAWFVPFLNLVRPKQIVNDIWRASDPAAPAQQGSSWQGRPVRPLLDNWWVLFIVAGVVSRLAGTSGDRSTLDEIATADRWRAASSVVLALSMIVTLAVVRAMVARQKERAAALGLS